MHHLIMQLYIQRVVLRDIDMLLLQNVDDLLEFDLPEDYIAATHVCACNPRRFPHYPHDWCGYTLVPHTNSHIDHLSSDPTGIPKTVHTLLSVIHHACRTLRQ